MSTSAVPIKESSASPSSFNHLSKSPGNLSRWSSVLPRTGLPSGRVTDDLNSALRLSPVFLGTSARPWLTLATTWTCRANPTKIHNLECGTSRQKSNLDSDRPTTQQWGKSKGKIQDRHGGKVQGLKSNTAPAAPIPYHLLVLHLLHGLSPPTLSPHLHHRFKLFWSPRHWHSCSSSSEVPSTHLACLLRPISLEGRH